MTSSYLSFARKYRPQSFGALYGQEVLNKVLTYSILNNRIASAYLLTGIRGVGKTSSARIIAKLINCSNLLTNQSSNKNNILHDKTPYIEPCETCNSCLSFLEQKHPDIIELDAASHTSVEDVRDIIETSKYRPLIGKYKVFIIDEAHMLSKNASSALLKLLEEPPLHAIFILATTEKQKIPLTIISRCQSYNLKRLTFKEILSLLVYISDNEKIKYEREALEIIAYKCDGSAREAVMMFEQASIVAVENYITSSVVSNMLGVLSVKEIIDFTAALLHNKLDKTLDFILNIYNNSINLEYFLENISDFFAYLSKLKILSMNNNTELNKNNSESFEQDIYSNFQEEISEMLKDISIFRLSILWQIFYKAINDIKLSVNQLSYLEMLIMKAIYAVSIETHEKIESANDYLDNNYNLENNSISLLDQFLKFLHSNNESKFYYFMLNEVEISRFFDNNLIFYTSVMNESVKQGLTKLLNQWTGEKWTVIMEKKNDIISLKQQMLNQIYQTSSWQLVKRYFPEALVDDIIRNKNIN